MNNQDWDIRLEGHPWGDKPFEKYWLAPNKMEMVDGMLFWNHEERMTTLALLLENVGAREATKLGKPEIWIKAIE